LLRFFVPSGITFLALPDGIPKAKIQFLQPLGRKEGPSNMTQKNGSINEENHTVGIVTEKLRGTIRLMRHLQVT